MSRRRTRGLFTGPQQPRQEPTGDTAAAAPGSEPTPVISTPQEAPQPRPHPDHPEWEQGPTAPLVFARLQGWTPGTFPPPAEDDTPAIAGERYTAHRELWHALQRWDREQARLDERAASSRRAEQARQDRAEQAERDAAAAAVAAQEQAERHAACLQWVQEQAGRIGLQVLMDHHQGRERVRLTAPDPGHPAVGPRHPWQRPGMLVRAGGGVVVDRAGETLAEVAEFLQGWEQELQAAQRERLLLDQQRRQAMLDAVRARVAD